MRLPPFEYLEPTSMEEALSMIDTHKTEVKIMAGGTDIINRMKLRLVEPAYVMNIGKVKTMDCIDAGNTEVVIGCGVRLKEIAESPLLMNKFKAIAEAASQVASPTIARMATIGGNILQNTRCMLYNQSGVVLNGLDRCHKRGGSVCLAVKGSNRCFSVYQGDVGPALIAFNARCVLEKKGLSRTIPVADLFSGNGAAPFTIAADELLTKIIIPMPEGTYGSAYRKLRLRGSIDYPLASAAAYITISDDMKITGCRVVIGAAGAAPKEIEKASSTMVGTVPDITVFEAMAEVAEKQAESADNLQMPGAYRKKMAGVLTKRAIKAALDRIREGK